MSILYPRAESKATIYVGRFVPIRAGSFCCAAVSSVAAYKTYIYANLGGFGDDMDEERLYSAFIAFGDVVEVFIPRDAESSQSKGKHRGFGFVEYERSEDARAAIDNMHMNVIFGHVIRCNIARPTRITMAAAVGASGTCIIDDCLVSIFLFCY